LASQPEEGTLSSIAERGVIVRGQQIASALSDAPRELLPRVPLVILPEIGFSWRDYRSLLERFAGGRRVFALDWPGFGASVKPAPANFVYTLANYTEVFARWLDSLGVARAVLLGNGLGAAVALRYALAHPQRVLGLAFVGPLGITPPEGWVGKLAIGLWRQRLMLRFSEPTLTSFALGPTTEAMNDIRARRRAERANANYGASLAAAAALIGSLASPTTYQIEQSATSGASGASQKRAETANANSEHPTELLTLAHGIPTPSLVLRGTLDPFCTANDARRLAELLGAHGALEVTLPDAGHLPFLQQPARCIQAIEGVIMTAEANAVAG
jgi:pimeloyl-ACP methyl ester carboxylesterase